MWMKKCWVKSLSTPLKLGRELWRPKRPENKMRAFHLPLRLILKSQPQTLLFSASTKRTWENKVVAARGTKTHPGRRHKNQTGWLCPKPYRPWVPQTKHCLLTTLTHMSAGTMPWELFTVSRSFHIIKGNIKRWDNTNSSEGTTNPNLVGSYFSMSCSPSCRNNLSHIPRFLISPHSLHPVSAEHQQQPYLGKSSTTPKQVAEDHLQDSNNAPLSSHLASLDVRLQLEPPAENRVQCTESQKS